MFIYANSVNRNIYIESFKTAEEVVIKMIENIYDDYKLNNNTIYTIESIQKYLQAHDENSSEAEDLMHLQNLYQKLKNGESLEKLVTELTNQELVICHYYDPMWGVSVQFDENKKLTAEAYSNVDNDYLYDAILEYVGKVI